ncbi:hypothetical protein DUC43_002754, partial [Enterococcus faecalis]|nr:hypothetical protein [Enterococcus faecalis]
MKKINNKNIFLLVISAVYLIMLMLNFLTPIMADDFTYTFKTGGFNTIFHDEYLHYLSTNGRSVAHIFVRIFLLMPKMVFNFVNPLIFVGVTFLIYRLTNFSSNKYNTVRYLLIVTTLFLFVPRFGEVFLWETG